jgi:hypothetical protein
MALISFGIPKLVRFDKIRPQQLIWYYYTCSVPPTRGLSARRVELTDGALARRHNMMSSPSGLDVTGVWGLT